MQILKAGCSSSYSKCNQATHSMHTNNYHNKTLDRIRLYERDLIKSFVDHTDVKLLIKKLH